MRITGAFLASWIAISAGELSAQYVVAPTSPLASSATALGSPASTIRHERLDSLSASIGELGEVSLAKHLALGAAIGGVAGYFIGGATAGRGGYPFRGKDVARVYGVVSGIAAGAIIGAVVWGIRRTGKTPPAPTPPAALAPDSSVS
jgi:hypothetical protein